MKIVCPTIKRLTEVRAHLDRLYNTYCDYVDREVNTSYNRGRADALTYAIDAIDAAIEISYEDD